MAFWTTVRQSKTKFHLFSNELKRCFVLNQVPYIVNRLISSPTLIPDLNNRNFIRRNNQLEFFYNVRFFAAPVQFNQKKEEKDTSGPRLNEQITTQFIRLVSDEGHGVISRNEALGLAKKLKLDLVEVDRIAKPPVCKILDYHKEKYLQQMKDKDRAKSKTELKKGAFKEVRFAAKIKQKDLQMKADMVKRLMESGHRVKCTAIEPTEDLDLETLLSRFSALIKDVAFEESEPKVEKKQAFIVVRHAKFGPSKKGSGKKASKSSESISNSLSKVGVSALTDSSSTKNQPLKENVDTVEAGWETGHELDSAELSDEDVQTNKSQWALFHSGDDFNTVFDITDGVNVLARNEESGIVTGTSPSSSDTSPRHVLESARAHTASSMSIEVPKHVMENRYARYPRNGNPSKIPTAMNDRGARNTINNVPQIPNQGKQPQFSMNESPQMRQPPQLEVPSHETSKQASPHSSIRYSPTNAYDPAARNPMNRVFQVPNQGKQPQVNMSASSQLRTPQQVEVPAYEVPRQDSSHSSIHGSPTESYGNFRSEQLDTTPREQSTNRYNKSVPSDSARSPNATVVLPYRNPPPSDSRIGRGPEVDKPREGRWGRFSTDSSNVIPNKNESQAEIQRR